MENQACTATEQQPVVSAFNDGVAVAAIARRIRNKPDLVERRCGYAKPKRKHRKRPIKREAGDSDHADSAKSLRKADLAFQRAMCRAVAQGLEHPPMIGIFKDATRLDAPRLFEPVPYSSGCTSPALVCAEFDLCTECPTIDSAGTPSYLRTPPPT